MRTDPRTVNVIMPAHYSPPLPSPPRSNAHTHSPPPLLLGKASVCLGPTFLASALKRHRCCHGDTENGKRGGKGGRGEGRGEWREGGRGGEGERRRGPARHPSPPSLLPDAPACPSTRDARQFVTCRPVSPYGAARLSPGPSAFRDLWTK